MICYRDRTFCSAPCARTDCSRNLNDDVRAAAQRWWGDLPGEVPISTSDMSKGCVSFEPLEVVPA